MNRLRTYIESQQRYIAYLTVGDGGMDRSLDACRALLRGGVDVLELGLPFSDPIADGPVIQRAAQRALQAGTGIEDLLQLASTLRSETDCPFIVFSYYNPLLAAGPDLYEKAKAAGIDGMLVVDLPIEESAEHFDSLDKVGLASVPLLSPSTCDDRMQMIDSHCTGFLYYACRKGITGVRNSLPTDLSAQISNIQSLCQAPLAVGFGIGDAEAASQVLQSGADAFVVGSAFVNALESGCSMEDLTTMAAALDPRQTT